MVYTLFFLAINLLSNLNVKLRENVIVILGNLKLISIILLIVMNSMMITQMNCRFDTNI